MRTFISYIRENLAAVDRLVSELEAAGVEVWLDRTRLLPGMRWADEIRRGISAGDSFVACFSEEYAVKSRTYMNEELTLAIDELRRRPTNKSWFIPVKLNECEIPDRSIGGGETLHSLQWVELYTDWNDGIRRILSVLCPTRSPSEKILKEINHDPSSDPPLFLIKEISKVQVTRLVRSQFGAGALVNWKKHAIRHRAIPGHKFLQELNLGEWFDKHLVPELRDAYGPGDIDYFETEEKDVVRIFWESNAIHRILDFTQDRVIHELYEFQYYMACRGLAFSGSYCVLLLMYRALELHAFDPLNWHWGDLVFGGRLGGGQTSILWALLSWLIWSWEQHTKRIAAIDLPDRHARSRPLNSPLECLANINCRDNDILQRVIEEERLSPPVSLLDLQQLLDDLTKVRTIAPASVELRAKLSSS